MKKKLISICLFLAIVLCSFSGVAAAFAHVSIEQCDRVFSETLNMIATDEEVGAASVTVLKKPVYDLNLSHLGYVYEFEIASGNGYAIIICDKGEYIANEFVPNAISPYANLTEELCVYANTMSYFKAVNGEICEIESSTVLPETLIASLKQTAILYSGSGIVTPTREKLKIEYISKSKDAASTCLHYPHYSNPSGLDGACAAIAGGNIVGYYDRFFEQLIPNHVSGEFYGDKFSYSLQDKYVGQIIEQLYVEMGGANAGITEEGFKSGLKSFCGDKGFLCHYTSLMSSGKLDYEAVKQCIKDGKPIVLFLSKYNNCETSVFDGYDIVNSALYTGNHVMVGFDYMNIKYTLTDGSTIDNRFIGVATGFGDPSTAYFNIDYKTIINSAYKVFIH